MSVFPFESFILLYFTARENHFSPRVTASEMSGDCIESGISGFFSLPLLTFSPSRSILYPEPSKSFSGSNFSKKSLKCNICLSAAQAALFSSGGRCDMSRYDTLFISVFFISKTSMSRASIL